MTVAIRKEGQNLDELKKEAREDYIQTMKAIKEEVVSGRLTPKMVSLLIEKHLATKLYRLSGLKFNVFEEDLMKPWVNHIQKIKLSKDNNISRKGAMALAKNLSEVEDMVEGTALVAIFTLFRTFDSMERRDGESINDDAKLVLANAAAGLFMKIEEVESMVRAIVNTNPEEAKLIE